MELDRSKHSDVTDEQAAAVKAAPETFEERLGGVISGIRKDYQGVPYEDPRAKALIDITTLMELCLIGHDLPKAIQQIIIEKGKQDNEIYRTASSKLDKLTAACLGDGDNLMAKTTALTNQLHAAVDDLYPEHGQHIAARVSSSRRQS